MAINDESLRHSRLLIPALMRVARLYGLPTYRGLEKNERGDIAYDPFFKDKCAIEHLRVYPEVLILYEQTRVIEQKTDLACEISKLVKELIDKIVDKIDEQFQENRGGLKDNTENVIIDDKALALGIISYIQSKNPKDIQIWGNMCKSGACINCREVGGWSYQVKTDRMMFGENTWVAEGNSEFLDKVRKFIEAEAKNESNLAEVAKIESLRREYSRIISALRSLVQTLIHDIKQGNPLKGECEICSKVKQ
jgi:hypothetical protein